jgi:hypothetical protein
VLLCACWQLRLEKAGSKRSREKTLPEHTQDGYAGLCWLLLPARVCLLIDLSLRSADGQGGFAGCVLLNMLRVGALHLRSLLCGERVCVWRVRVPSEWVNPLGAVARFDIASFPSFALCALATTSSPHSKFVGFYLCGSVFGLRLISSLSSLPSALA